MFKLNYNFVHDVLKIGLDPNLLQEKLQILDDSSLRRYGRITRIKRDGNRKR